MVSQTPRPRQPAAAGDRCANALRRRLASSPEATAVG